MRNKKGSILAYSLIILAMMLAIAISISISTITEKKAASGTESSMQSIQTADSGAQIISKQLATVSSGTIANAFPVAMGSCSGSKFTATSGTAGPATSKYEVTFYGDTGNVLACSDDVSLVKSITSVGAYNGTARAVNMKASVINACDGAAGVTKTGGIYILTDIRGSETINYRVVAIGSQCWMAENLRTAKKPNGAGDLTEGNGMYSNPSCYNSPCGRFYDGQTALNGTATASSTGAKIQGLCPSGWHIPSDYNASATEDFQKLANFYGGSYNSASYLRVENFFDHILPTPSFEYVKFSAVPAGWWNGSSFTGYYSSVNPTALFYSSGACNVNGYCVRALWPEGSDENNFLPTQGISTHGYSIRCIKD